jgi:hypothetical protein
VLVEMLIDRGGRGLVATWQVDVRPVPGAAANGRDDIVGLRRVGVVGALYRLALDTSQEFSVHDMTFSAPDLKIVVTTGTAFRAVVSEGVTALVLRGTGEMQFRPADPIERGQLVIFGKRPDLVAPIDAAFIRISPADFSTRVSDGSLVPVAPNKNDADRAAAVFDDRALRTYHLGLGDLSAQHWSMLPQAGDVVAEMETRRFGWLTYVRAGSDPEDISLFDRQNHHNIATYASPDRLKNRGRFFSEDDDLRFHVEDFDLDVHFVPERALVSGTATLRGKVLRDGTTSLSLHLAESLAVSSVTSSVHGRLLFMRPINQNGLIVHLPDIAMRGDSLTLTISYGGRLVPQALDRESIRVSPDEQDPQVPIDAIQIVPEPLYAYSTRSAWYPQSNVTDYATGRMKLTVPGKYQLVSNGRVTGSSDTPVPGGRSSPPEVDHTVQLVVDRPVRYLAVAISRLPSAGRARADVPAIASSLLAPEDHEPGPAQVSIETVATPRQVHRGQSLAARAAEIFSFYASMIGEAPYPNFTLAAVDADLPGGHSPAYFAVLNQQLATSPYSWKNDPVAFDDYPHFFLAHEIAHQWWGQAIGTKNYHEQWLSEGLAQYFAARYAGVDRGAETERGLLARMQRSAMTYGNNGPISLGYRLGHVLNDSRIFRAIVYNKAAVVLHMLHQMIGDDAFTAGIRRYYREQRFHKAGTEDLQLAFETESHRSLGRFFDQWIRSADVPRLRVSTQFDAAGDAATIHVEQIGTTFDVPLTVEVEYTDGRTESLTFTASEATTDHRIRLKGKTRRVSVDEDLTLAVFVK